SLEVALGHRQDVSVEIAFVADQGATLASAGIEAAPPPRHQQPKNSRPQGAVEVEEVSVVPESKLTGHRRDRILGVQGQHIVEMRVIGEEWSKRGLGQRRDGRSWMPCREGAEQRSDEQDVAGGAETDGQDSRVAGHGNKLA